MDKDTYYHILLATNMTIGGKKLDGLDMAYEELKDEKEGENNGKND